MKKDQYFNLEVNFLSNDNIVRMMMELDAAQSLGIYMMLLTHLRKADNYEASCCPLCMGAFARMYDLDAGVLQRVLREFDLFVLDEERQMFRSPYLDRVMARLEERRMINVANGKKGGRPKRMESTPETPMDKGEKPNQNQKSREEERRVTTVVKDNNSSNEEKTEKENSAAASDRLQIVSPPEDRGQLPLQPVLPWEMLGKLFVERQEEVIAAFKEHIRRFGREDGLLFLRDVKLYFGNYLSPGGRPAQELKKRLLGSCRQSAEEELYRVEQLIGGQRTYLGHPIPKDAPPRPDRSAVWDEVHWKWGN